MAKKNKLKSEKDKYTMRYYSHTANAWLFSRNKLLHRNRKYQEDDKDFLYLKKQNKLLEARIEKEVHGKLDPLTYRKPQCPIRESWQTIRVRSANCHPTRAEGWRLWIWYSEEAVTRVQKLRSPAHREWIT